MNSKLMALQIWLNAKGWEPKLDVDGLDGPKTRRAFYELFANKNAPAVTDAQRTAFAKRLGGTLKQMRAVETVESGGSGFLPTGHPKILFERHYFFKRIQIVIPGISNPKGGGYTLDANNNGVNDSWEKLTEAAMRSPAYAMESCSWGKFQVMGAHWKHLGYASAAEYAWSMRESEAGHYEALVRYIQRNSLAGAFQRLSTNPNDCRDFARGYNGTGYAAKGYHEKLAEAMS